jgi:S1-C subfamily serine protease
VQPPTNDDELGTAPASSWPPPPPPGGWYGDPWGSPPWGEPPTPAPRPPRRRAALALLGIALVLLAAGAALIGLVNRNQQQGLGSLFTRGTSNLDVAAITARVSPAVVDITASFPDGLVAGTGMVITSSGEVLTNNHVVDSATAIEAQVGGSGPVYSARVLGTDAGADVALLQLDGASRLSTVSVASSSVGIGDSVVAIGNALGRQGPPSGSGGQVTGVDRTITATDQSGQSTETLTGLIQVDANVLPGDSGGPLVDGSGRVVGMDTAASARHFRFVTGGSEGFAIPIGTAMSVARELRSSAGSGGSASRPPPAPPALLGVQLSNSGSDVAPGVLVAGVQPGSPADAAGIAAGDVIVSLDGRDVQSAAQLRSAIRGHHPGDRVSIAWVDPSGQQRTASVRLAAAAN